MRLLIVCATSGEFPLLDTTWKITLGTASEVLAGAYPNLSLSLLVTGAGMVPTTYFLSKELLANRYDLVINIGIAGCFHSEIKPGTVFQVVEDCFAWWGSEDANSFQPIFNLGLLDPNSFPFTNGTLLNTLMTSGKVINRLRTAKSITVNTVHGKETSIKKAINQYAPDLETMEGAAFFYVCMMQKTACIQLRSVSNLVERRNKKAWDIPRALKNLAETTEAFLKELAVSNTI